MKQGLDVFIPMNSWQLLEKHQSAFSSCLSPNRPRPDRVIRSPLLHRILRHDPEPISCVFAMLSFKSTLRYRTNWTHGKAKYSNEINPQRLQSVGNLQATQSSLDLRISHFPRACHQLYLTSWGHRVTSTSLLPICQAEFSSTPLLSRFSTSEPIKQFDGFDQNSPGICADTWSLMFRRNLDLPVHNSASLLSCAHCQAPMGTKGDHAVKCRRRFGIVTCHYILHTLFFSSMFKPAGLPHCIEVSLLLPGRNFQPANTCSSKLHLPQQIPLRSPAKSPVTSQSEVPLSQTHYTKRQTRVAMQQRLSIEPG